MDYRTLEAMQGMVEHRKDRETGVAAVQLIEEDAVWEAGEAGRWSHLALQNEPYFIDAPASFYSLIRCRLGS